MFAIIVLFFIFNSAVQNAQWWVIQNLLIWLALFFSVLSGVIYILNIYKPRHRHA
jgi:phosphatidylglycerophosphate synthase